MDGDGKGKGTYASLSCSLSGGSQRPRKEMNGALNFWHTRVSCTSRYYDEYVPVFLSQRQVRV